MCIPAVEGSNQLTVPSYLKIDPTTADIFEEAHEEQNNTEAHFRLEGVDEGFDKEFEYTLRTESAFMTAMDVEFDSQEISRMMECVAMDSKRVQGDGYLFSTSSSSSTGDLKEELISQVSLALGVIENVRKMSSTIWVNKNQCKRLADRFSVIGEGLKALGLDKSFFVCGKIPDGPGSKDLPPLDKILAVLRKGEALILHLREWKGIISVVIRADSREAFKEIHEELDTMKVQFDIEGITVESGLVKGFELNSGTERSALITADAEKDSEEMSKMLERGAMDSEIVRLDSFLETGDSSDLPCLSSKWGDTNVGGGFQPGENHHVSVPIDLRIEPGDIKKVRQIGSGASAKVYEATWLGYRCAVKRFKSAYSRMWISELQQELNFLIELSHPHIVRLMGLSVDSKQRCSIVMELMSGSLRDLIDSRLRARSIEKKTPIVPFKFFEAVGVITQIALGMLFLHSKGISHRDLKSGNVMVQYSDGYTQVKIVDFGASRHIDSSRMQAVIGVGTGLWRAPEILPSKTADRLSKPDLMAADVYSFAMTCYEVVTGGIPFDGQIKSNEYEKVINGLRPELPENLDRDLTSLIKSCWALDPKDRPNFENICEQLVYIKSKEWVRRGTDQAIDSPKHESSDSDSDSHMDADTADSAILVPEYLRIQPDQLKLGQKIGNGYFPTYEATWLDCPVAVRKFKFHSSTQELQQEVDFLVKLSRHPYIAQMLGLSVHSHQKCSLVMELMSYDLRELIDSQMLKRRSMQKRRLATTEKVERLPEFVVAPFDLHEAVLIITKIALGMAFLHSKGVMHRDLKSSNVMVKAHPGSIDVKIMDFGVAQHEYISDSTHKTHGLGTGTRFWRAPEILPSRTTVRPKNPDLKAADVYSFAMTCYEVLTGEIPLSDLRPKDYDIVISGLRPTLPSDLHPELKALIEQCWHGEPEKRPHFTEICEELQKIEQEFVSAIPETT